MELSDPRPVLAEFLALDTVRRIEPLDNAGGWSGSSLWRVQAEGRTGLGASMATSPRLYCLRRWPAGTDPERLRFIHKILTHVAAGGIDFVPTPLPLARRTSVSLVHSPGGGLWDLAPWLPGTADYHAHPTRERLAAAMRALARFHDVAGRYQQLPGPVPAISDRLEQVQHLLSGDLDRITSAVLAGLDAALDLRASRVLALTRDRLSPLLGPLEFASGHALPLSPAIRDIHHDHVLFTGDNVSGLVDFGALRIDTPLADVARLVGSLVGDDQPQRQFALAAYAQLRPLTDHDRRLIDLLDHSGLVLGGLNWLRWLYVERRDMGPLPPIQKRLDEILARLLTPPN
ncbi:MAG: aminoglycoside phosphotransferase family protein [Planctomycetaceae bacterium]|nr:aminoglycoside phosphotransferase family protein [Planctomycetaceae bacterium]